MSLAVRRGRSTRARKVGLDLYRRVELPAYLRNLWIVMPLLAGGLVPVAIEVFVAQNVPTSTAVPPWLGTLIAYGSVAYGFLVFGSVLVLGSRPPKWLLPTWLREDDRASGFRPPSPTWFDRAWGILGVLFILAGLVALGLLFRAVAAG